MNFLITWGLFVCSLGFFKKHCCISKFLPTPVPCLQHLLLWPLHWKDTRVDMGSSAPHTLPCGNRTLTLSFEIAEMNTTKEFCHTGVLKCHQIPP